MKTPLVAQVVYLLLCDLNNLSSMYEKNVIPEKQALNSQKGLFYPVSQQSLNEIGDIFLCVCEVFRGKFRNDVLRGDILLLTYIELRLNR
jgi:hypothetical protein